MDGIWLKVTHGHRLIAKKSTRPRLRLQVESRYTEVIFPRLYIQKALNPKHNRGLTPGLPNSSSSPKLLDFSFCPALRSQLKGDSMAAQPCSATSSPVRSTTARENPLPLREGKRAEGSSRVLLTRREGKQRGFISCLFCEEMSAFSLLTTRLS